TDAPTYRGRLLHHVEPGDARRTRVGREQGREDPDEGGLARAVGSQEGHHPTFGHRQVDTAERLRVPERTGDAFDVDDRVHGSCFPSCTPFQKDTPSNDSDSIEAASCSVNAQSASTSARS